MIHKYTIVWKLSFKSQIFGLNTYYMWWWFSHSVMSDSLWPYELQLANLLCSWNSPGKNTGGGCHFLLRGNFPAHVSCNTGRSFTGWATREALLVYARHYSRLGIGKLRMKTKSKLPPVSYSLWMKNGF